jgi:hypothetical protein
LHIAPKCLFIILPSGTFFHISNHMRPFAV